MSFPSGLQSLAKRAAKRGMRSLGRGRVVSCTELPPHLRPDSAPTRALHWIRKHVGPWGGVRPHVGTKNGSPEITGRLVPVLLAYGERELAERLTRWLRAIQAENGGYADSESGELSLIATGEALRALIALRSVQPEALESARRAADFLCAQAVEGGKCGFGERAESGLPPGALLCALPALTEAAEVLDHRPYRQVAGHCADFYARQPGVLHAHGPTSVLGSALGALIEMGRVERAVPFLEEIRQRQRPDGSLPGHPGASWVDLGGMAQIIGCWYRILQWECADRAINWLVTKQRPSGGFFGSVGAGASVEPDREVARVVPFYLDAHLQFLWHYYERNVDELWTPFSEQDARAKAVVSAVRPGDRVLEIGSGYGSFLSLAHHTVPEAECVGIDISPAAMAYTPAGVRVVRGAQEAIPFPDESFDVVYSIETLPLSVNPLAALEEMTRVARPGARLLLMDIPHSSQSPRSQRVRRALQRACDHVTAEKIAYSVENGPSGEVMVWRAQKRSRLTGSEWNKAHVEAIGRRETVEQVRFNRISEWAQALVLHTREGESVLEIGCGTGGISLLLAKAGRRVTALDIEPETLKFVGGCAKELDVAVELVQADAEKRLPFSDGAFDCVWSSGLLEHYGPEERVSLLRECARVSRRRMIHIVPNAHCLGYRVGKRNQEERGEWPFGLEMPLASLRDEFEAVGLRVLMEYTVGIEQGLDFLPPTHPIRTALESGLRTLLPPDLIDCRQGYLRITVGDKAR